MLAAELAVCERMSIPHSQFLGGDGVWTDLDRIKALSYAAEKAARCPSCGTRPEEWDEDAGGHQYAYIADSHRCPGCELLELERDAIPEHVKGVTVRLAVNPELAGEVS